MESDIILCMDQKTCRIGTRGSKLAMAQAEGVRTRLAAAYPGIAFELVVVKTRGDAVTDRPLSEVGGSALFTHELECALKDGRVDMAVHSMKDLPADCAPGLVLAKAWTREDPRDALVCRAGAGSVDTLPEGAVVATGSVRRTALLLRRRPDLRIEGIRGNIDTRLRKLFSPVPGEPVFDAIVLAAAGLRRLGLQDVVSEYLDPEWMIPAPNQGQLAIELREADEGLRAMVDALGDDDAEAVASAERAFLKSTGADCHRAVGALASVIDGRIALSAVDGTTVDDIRIVRRTAGRVTLVGAGPGDPGLITVRGLSAIREADAIVYDRLASEDLLKEAKAGCDLVYVGKESGNHSLPQPEINALLLRKALEHGRVVRLKGGDPFVFGRGGEEMEYLVARRIPCEVVPGVSSAIAAAESAHIPVTHRGVALGFDVVTAHAMRDGGLSDADFARMLDERRTLVFMMGLARVGETAARLVAAGRRPDTPAAVVGSATSPDACCVAGTLRDIAARVAEAGVASPAVFIVGDVVALRSRLGFPLSGRRFLVPVIEGGSGGLSRRIRRLGGIVDEVCVGRIVKIENAFGEADLDGVDRIVLTSRNGWLGLDDRMRAAAEARGICVEEVREVRPIGRTLHLTQPDADRVAGVKSIDVYRNEVVPIVGAIDLGRYDAAFFTCASSARRVHAAAAGKTLEIAIGPKTAAELERVGAERIAVAAKPTLDSLVDRFVSASTMGASV